MSLWTDSICVFDWQYVGLPSPLMNKERIFLKRIINENLPPLITFVSLSVFSVHSDKKMLKKFKLIQKIRIPAHHLALAPTRILMCPHFNIVPGFCFGKNYSSSSPVIKIKHQKHISCYALSHPLRLKSALFRIVWQGIAWLHQPTPVWMKNR